MALIKNIKIGGMDLSYWHLFQLNFDYQAETFVARFNGYPNLEARTNTFNNVEGYRPIHTDSYFLDRVTANQIAKIIYENAKEMDTYYNAIDDNSVFSQETAPEVKEAPARAGSIRSSLYKIFKKS